MLSGGSAGQLLATGSLVIRSERRKLPTVHVGPSAAQQRHRPSLRISAIFRAQRARKTSPPDGAIMALSSRGDVAQSAEQASKPPWGAGGCWSPS